MYRYEILDIPSQSDEQYLFRLATTFGWDEVVSLCNSLIHGMEERAGDDVDADTNEDKEKQITNNNNYYEDIFNYSHNNQERETLEQWLHRAYKQLFYVDQWGNTPLHAASYVKPPDEVIDALFMLGRAIWKFSSSQKETPVWGICCKDGSTPFLVASSTGASPSVLRRYIDEIEYYIDQQWVHPQAARLLVVQPDNQGISPLIGFMSCHNNWIKRQLGEQATINHLNNQFNSLDLLGSRYKSGIISRQQKDELTLLNYWNLVCQILRFATMNIHPHSPVSSSPVLVHRCCSIAPYCPVSLLKWVVSPRTDDRGWSSGDVCASTPDTKGKWPLHRAMESVCSSSIFDEDIVHHGINFDNKDDDKVSFAPTDTKIPAVASSKRNDDSQTTSIVSTAEMVCPREDAIIYNNPKLERNRVQVISQLLQWHPKLATIPFPNNGRVPLIQAIAYGGNWHIESDKYKLGILQLLWTYAPEHSLEIDPITGLYPFMLAATIPLSNNDENENEQVVDNVFNLLRKNPQLVCSGIVTH